MSDTVLGLSAKLVLSNLRVKHLSESVHKQDEWKKRKRKVIEELRASGSSETLFMSPSKVQKTRDIISSREQEKERDERAATAFARKTAAAQKKAAAQAAREAREAQKQTKTDSRAGYRRSRSQSERER